MKFLNIYKYTAVLLAVVLFTSCNKFLDVEPKGKVIPTTLDDFIALLSNPDLARTSNNAHFFTDEITLPEDYRSAARGYPGAAVVKAYDFENELYDVSEDDKDWDFAYKTIYIANSVLFGLESNMEQNQAKRNQAKGEALVQRAYTYLTLVNEYAKHYSSSAETDMGVPLNIKVDINALSGRASVKAVYTQIEKDLLEAANILPTTSTYITRPGKAAAYGTLARMYLYMGDWVKAEEYASKALAIYNFIYDYNDFEQTTSMTKITGYPASTMEKKHIVFLKFALFGAGYDFNFLYSAEQYDLFNPVTDPTKANVNDLRQLFGSTSKSLYGPMLVGGKGIIEIAGPYDYNNSGITTQELILTRAEALARLNKTQLAMDDLNTLRKNRIPKGKYADLTAATPADALNLVLRERRVELAFSGLRLADIKRLNLEGRNISVTHGSKTLPANSPRFVLPIPSKVISLNSNIIQNPR